ncbi:hypothetical protein SAMN05421736_10863 [Evansella caseinilytica]|uniref:Uncharacterized protein n=1 Tax=Evansella caseinilytica TaxID=1503961 RepID=A0A1H3RF49_9BACI|nr:hypothetical protein SAMN05421736_10863 [Evansella caseinilytica]
MLIVCRLRQVDVSFFSKKWDRQDASFLFLSSIENNYHYHFIIQSYLAIEQWDEIFFFAILMRMIIIVEYRRKSL